MLPQPNLPYYAEVANAVQTTLIQAGPEYKYEVVDVSRLVDTLMIAFRWHETSDRLFVYVADLHLHVDSNHPVDMAETIISTNFLEKLGGGWFEHVRTFSIGRLTFFS
jgi:hypothetical protein